MTRIVEYFVIASLSLVFFSCNNPSTEKSQEKTDKPEIAILGVFHFAGSSTDLASIQIDSVLSERRQQEIDNVLKKLEAFHPDKILVEYPFQKDEQLNASYQKYLDGNMELTENETHQLGFKLGRRLGHKKLYAADYKLPLHFNDLKEFAKTHGKEEKLDAFIKNVQDHAKKKSKYLEEHTILEYLTQLNTDTSDIWNKNLYLGPVLEMGQDSLYPGAKIVGEYYKRNLYILANIQRIMEADERALLIIGSGHRAFIKQYIKDKKDFEYVEIHDYLVKD